MSVPIDVWAQAKWYDTVRSMDLHKRTSHFLARFQQDLLNLLNMDGADKYILNGTSYWGSIKTLF